MLLYNHVDLLPVTELSTTSCLTNLATITLDTYSNHTPPYPSLFLDGMTHETPEATMKPEMRRSL